MNEQAVSKIYTKKYNEAVEEYMNLENKLDSYANQLRSDIDRFCKILKANGVDGERENKKKF